MKKRLLTPLTLALACLAGSISSASAETFTWTNPAASGGWSTAAFWSPSGFPLHGDAGSSHQLIFDSRDTAFTASNNVASSLGIHGITLRGTGSAQTTLTMAAGAAPLKMVSAEGAPSFISQESSSTLLINGVGGMLLDSTLTLTGNGSGIVNLNTALSGTGGLVVDGGATYTLGAVNTFSGGTTVKSGTLRVATGSASVLGSGALTMSGGKISSVSATAKTFATTPITITGGSTVTFGDTVLNGALTFGSTANLGHGAHLIAESDIRFTGALTSGGDLMLVQKGLAEIQFSQFDIAGGVTLEGTLGGKALAITGGLTNSDDSSFIFTLSGGIEGNVYTVVKYGSTTLDYSDLTWNGEIALDPLFGQGGWLIGSQGLEVRLIPEPSQISLLFGAGLFIGTGSLLQRRARKKIESGTSS